MHVAGGLLGALGRAWQDQAALLLGGSHVPAPASHLLPPASQNRKALAFSRYQLHAPLPLSLGWGSSSSLPCSSMEDVEGVNHHPDRAQSWTNECNQNWGCPAPGLGTRWREDLLTSVFLVKNSICWSY